jgi:hypothetical protein
MWTGGNARSVATRQHDAVGHETWVDVSLCIKYGGKSQTEAAEWALSQMLALSQGFDRPHLSPNGRINPTCILNSQWGGREALPNRMNCCPLPRPRVMSCYARRRLPGAL